MADPNDVDVRSQIGLRVCLPLLGAILLGAAIANGPIAIDRLAESVNEPHQLLISLSFFNYGLVFNRLFNSPLPDVGFASIFLTLSLLRRGGKRLANILASVAVLDLLVAFFLLSIISRPGPGIISRGIPDVFAMCSMSFWGFLAVAFRGKRSIKGVLIAFFLLAVVSSIVFEFYFDRAWCADIIAGLLIGAAVQQAALLIDEYAGKNYRRE